VKSIFPCRLINRNRAAQNSRLQRLALNQLHDDAPLIGGFFETKDMRNVGMIQLPRWLVIS
jgi:hypothetical protein